MTVTDAQWDAAYTAVLGLGYGLGAVKSEQITDTIVAAIEGTRS